MNRRRFITLLGGAAAAWPFAARAQLRERVYRIGFLANDPTIPTTPPGQAFLEGLRESGFVEGQNITIERRFARGRVGVGPELAAELVRLDLDLVVASGDQNVVALKRATSKIPIVMVNAIDPSAQASLPVWRGPAAISLASFRCRQPNSRANVCNCLRTLCRTFRESRS